MASVISTGLLGDNLHILTYALLGGILPALVWLWFWIQEDKLHPEPQGRIMAAFIGGTIAVPLVYPLEKLASIHFGDLSPTTLLTWAIIEECAKFIMAWIIALRSRDNDEPIDALEYMITVALGFAALENTLFILTPLLDGNIVQSLMAGNMRFIGASLLHVVSSAVLGYCIGREFYRGKLLKNIWRVAGLCLAIALHTIFNVFIIYDNGSKTFFIFGCVWAAAIGVLLLFEKIKRIKK